MKSKLPLEAVRSERRPSRGYRGGNRKLWQNRGVCAETCVEVGAIMNGGEGLLSLVKIMAGVILRGGLVSRVFSL